MILATSVFLSAFGFAAWALGHFWDYQGIAAIGAVLVIGVGAAAMVDGLETQSGTVETQLDANTTEVEQQYQSIGTTQSFPVGVVVTLLGTGMIARALEIQL